MIELIASTTTKAGLTERCELNTRDYPKGIKVSDAEMMTLNIEGDTFHPEWTRRGYRPEAADFGRRLSPSEVNVTMPDERLGLCSNGFRSAGFPGQAGVVFRHPCPAKPFVNPFHLSAVGQTGRANGDRGVLLDEPAYRDLRISTAIVLQKKSSGRDIPVQSLCGRERNFR